MQPAAAAARAVPYPHLPGGLLLSLPVAGDFHRAFRTRRGTLFGKLALHTSAVAFPFFSAGAVVSLVISETIERVERVTSSTSWARPPDAYIVGPNAVLLAAPVYAISAAIWYKEW